MGGLLMSPGHHHRESSWVQFSFPSLQNTHEVSSWQKEKTKAPHPVLSHTYSAPPLTFPQPLGRWLHHYAVHLLFLHPFLFRRRFMRYLRNHKSH